MFIVLAYGFAWALWAHLLPEILDTLRDGRTPDRLEASAAVTLGMYAPALAALVMRLWVSGEGLAGVLGPRPRPGLTVTVVLFPMIWVLAVVGLVHATGIGQATPDGSLPVLLVLLLFIGVPISAILAFGEEFGWRGYLLPRLLPLGELRAAALVAAVWGPWHLPILLVGLNYPGENVVALVATFMVSVLMLSILHARVFVASGGSLVLVALLHGSLNNFADRLTDPDHLSGGPLVVSGGGIVASAMLTPILVVLYRRLHGRRSRGPRLMMRNGS